MLFQSLISCISFDRGKLSLLTSQALLWYGILLKDTTLCCKNRKLLKIFKIKESNSPLIGTIEFQSKK